VPGVQQIQDLRLRWVGHRLQGDATITVDPTLSLDAAHAVSAEAEREVREHLHTVDDMRIRAIPAATPTR
jgi:divalent metal cation (Fe/Co/Zn/Cd) transporter